VVEILEKVTTAATPMVALILAGLVFTLPRAEAQSWTATGGAGGRIAYAAKHFKWSEASVDSDQKASDEAFVSDVEGSQIRVVNADGSGKKILTPDGMNAQDPAWSPDGRQIAFVRIGPGGSERDVCIMDGDGGNLRILTHSRTPHLCNWEPDWSPDGKTIVFVSSGDSDAVLCSIGADGANMRRLTAKPESGYSALDSPRWSPDGTRILFEKNGSLMVMESDGSNPRTIIAKPDEPPAGAGGKVLRYSYMGYTRARWSPNGLKIACIARNETSSDGSTFSENDRLVVIDDLGSSRVLPGPEGDSFGAPIWSPDGAKIAFSDESTQTFHIASVDGSKMTPEPTNGNSVNSVGWSPDGLGIALLTESPRAGEHSHECLFVARADGSDPRKIDDDIGDSAEAAALCAEAVKLYNAGNLDQTLATYLKAVQLDPRSVAAQESIGLLYYNKSAFDAAIPYLKEALSLRPDRTADYRMLAVCEMRTNQFQAALEPAAEYYKRDEGERAADYLGTICFHLGQTAQAAAWRRKADASSHPYGAGAFTDIAMAAASFDAKRYQEAVDLAQPEVNKVEFYSNYRATGLTIIGVACHELHEEDRAAEAFAQAVEACPTIPAIHLALGRQYVQMGQYDRAIPALQDASLLDPGYASPYEWAGHAYFAKGDCALAARMYELAHQSDPGNANYCEWLGLLWRLQGQYARAEEVAQEEMLIDPEKTQPYWDEADAFMGLAKYDEAIAVLDRGSSLPEGQQLRRYRDCVARLKESIGPAPAELASSWTTDATYQTVWWGAVNAGYPWHRGFSAEVWAYYWDRAQAAEAANNLYSAFELYVFLFKNCPDWGEYAARLEEVRGRIFTLYPRLPVKIAPGPLVADFARKAQEQAQMSVGVTTGNRFVSAANFYSMALDEAPWWAEGYFNLAVARSAMEGPDNIRSAIANMRIYASLAGDAPEREKAERLIELWSNGGALP
jgi:TolB protein